MSPGDSGRDTSLPGLRRRLHDRGLRSANTSPDDVQAVSATGCAPCRLHGESAAPTGDGAQHRLRLRWSSQPGESVYQHLPHLGLRPRQYVL
jgi:hypothetical protein